MGDTAFVPTLPNCDVCRPVREVEAKYDAKTIHGPWAHLCEEHYMTHRYYDTLGTGKGQKLEVRS